MADERNTERRPWDRLPDEPTAAYERFLHYLTLGRFRTIDEAFRRAVPVARKGKKSRGPSKNKRSPSPSDARHASGQWTSDSATYHWAERALAKDIEDMATRGYETVIDFMNVMAILANKTLKAVADDKIRPRSLKTALQLVELLGSYIPAETVAAVRADAEQHRISRVGRGEGSAGDGAGSPGDPGRAPVP